MLGATDPQELISGGYLAQYTPDPQTMHIKYVNQKTNEVVKDDPVNGYTDKTVDTNSSVPGGGWKLVDGQQPAPKQITFKVGKTPDIIIIKVEHAHVTVLPTDPKTPLDELPDRAFEGYPTGVAENDLNKKIKRTINVHNLDGTITPIVQTAHLTRTADVDEVTLEVTYSDWTTGSWDKFTSTPVAGYTASLTELPAVKVYATTNDEIRDVIYTANNQSMRINYVSDDGDNVGEVIDFTPVNGHTDETVETNGKVPAGWKLADGQSIPAKITFKGAKTDDVSVKVKHAHVTVLPDNPKTTVDKLPDNENKNYPTGVAYTDLNKTITRTIEIDEPNGNIIFVPKQEVHYTRTADVDEVTGDVTYGNWTTTDEFAEFDGVPGIPGYAPSQSKVDAMTPKVDDHDSTVKITYTANEQSMHIIYVDGEGNTVKTDPVSGHTDETVKTNSTVPAGWKLADGQQPAPERITFKGAKTDDQTIKVKPAHVIVTADKPKTTVDKLPDNPTKNYPNGVAENDLNKTVKRTINVHNTDGTTTTVIQSVHFTRNADVDEAHGTVEYSEWKADKQFEQYIIPTVPGYVSVVDGKEQTMIQPAMPSISDHDSTIEVNYQAVDGSQTIDYVDKNDTVVGYQIITGKTSEEKTVKSAVPTGWKLVDGQQVPTTVTIKAKDVPIKIWIEHDHVQVSHDDPQVDGTKIPGGAADFHGVAKSDLNKTITRTITVVDPHKGAQTVTQPATIHRDATVDKVDGSVVYGDWTTAEWPAYEVPAVAGYTPSQATVGAQTVTNETKDTPVTVTYTANAQTMHIKYVDAQGNVVKSDPVSGHTDETVKTNSTVPAGWKLADGQSVPTEITFKGAKTDDVTVKVEHDHVQVSHDDPQVDGTKIPGGAADFHGVAKSDLNKTITRTITVVDPYKGAQTVTQPATIHRDATVDKVDGSVVYGDWTTAEWPAYKVPVVDGYTPSQATVGAQTVTSETKDTPVTVTYAANAQTMHIKYVDAQGNVVKSDPVSGHTDETVKTNSTVPAGWKLMNGQSVPATIKFSANTPDVTVKVEHSYVTVLPDNPKTPADVLPDNPGKNYPSGVAKDDLNKTVTRTINITTPDGKTRTITQKAEFTRSATVDEVTGEVTYGPWSKNVVLESVDVPNIPGYAPSASVPEITVTPNDQDTTINITYKKLGSGNAAGQGGNASNGGSTTGQTAQNGQSGQTPNNAGAQQLPQTGNANNEKSALGLAGAMFAAGLGLGFGSKKKRHED
ncbi:LPXTG cell wall anchor domain-containing protein [Limosilactobacillus mucosae]|uniref:mucin-binding protein n=2 Tax=Limosilactobacillus mucosae TaxID=97478 RepID=UPI001F046465|nr:LPXTG cell wall anchor domain-containing protein [Limosilactobacillus mucosae]